MTTIVQVANANELCQEYVRITTMLSYVQNGGYTLNVTVIPPGLVGVSCQLAPTQGALTGLLQARQTALANQLAAMGITPT